MFHVSSSMGSLFSSWQRDKCCIVRFLSLNGLGRFVFWTRGRMPALSSVGLLISPVQSTPSGEITWGGASPPTRLPPSTTWLNDVSPFWGVSTSFVTYTVKVKHPLNELQDYPCLQGWLANTRWEIYCWLLLRERSRRDSVLILNWQHALLGWWIRMPVTSGRWEMRFFFVFDLFFPWCQVQLVAWQEFC